MSFEQGLSGDAKAALAAAWGGNTTQKAEEKQKKNAAENTEKDTPTLVMGIIQRVAHLDKDEVTPAATLTEDLNLDSLSLIEISVRLEDRLKVRMEDSDLHATRTVGDVIALIETRKAAVQTDADADKANTEPG